ncbi:MAG: class I SAM-dependent methyltransferase [Pontixanthobacter sp.]
MADAVSEFDAVAEDYEDQHASSIRFSGEETGFFAEQKAASVAEQLHRAGKPHPGTILDFGAGTGNSVGPLQSEFPESAITCLDVSQRSLQICAERTGGSVETMVFDGERIEAADKQFELVFTACVFHHIEHEHHIRLLRELRRTLGSGGNMFLFEHNPWNPLTRLAVARCPFDENAVLISAPVMRQRFLSAGFSTATIQYGVFFPRFLAWLRPFEKYLGWLPMGAQYSIRATVS